MENQSDNSVVRLAPRGRGGKRAGAGRPRRHPQIENLRLKDDGGLLMPLDRSYVYVVQEVGTDDVCKIGKSNDPYKRLGALQVSTWRKLRLAAIFCCSDEQAAELVERESHRFFSGAHVSGEWFRVTPKRAAAEIEDLAQRFGIAARRASGER